MAYYGRKEIDDVLVFYANTHDPSDGSASDADAPPTYRVYEQETGTAILTGSMALLDTSNTTGFYSESITLSAANGFEVGKNYAIYIEAAVGGVTGTTHHNFDVEAQIAQETTVIADTEAILSDTEQTITDTAAILADSEAILTDTGTTLPASLATLLTDTEASQTAEAAILADTEASQTAETSLLADTEAIVADTEAILTDSEAALADTELWTSAHAEPTGVPSASATPLTKLGVLYMMARNKLDVTATKKKFYDNAGNTEFEQDLTDDGTTYSQSQVNTP